MPNIYTWVDEETNTIRLGAYEGDTWIGLNLEQHTTQYTTEELLTKLTDIHNQLEKQADR